MFPIRDHNPSDRTPVVTLGLIAVNILVFLVSLPYFSSERALYAFFGDWAMIPAAISSGQNLHGLFTSMFLHAGFMHLAGNMLFLWIFGDNLEDQMGHVGFLAFYVICGLAAAGAHLAADPMSRVPTVGASGAIGGVMGGYLLLFPKARVDVLLVFVIFFRVVVLPAWMMLGLWFLMQLLSGVAVDASMGGIAYWAHAGGFLTGLALTVPVWLRRGARSYWDRTAGRPPHPESRYSRSSVPLIRRKK
ncbi:rhomboid family intramembrane serine protease [Ostreiculturibacter nitratireducens]|uniref:rhomboid family intramembrane serine protease n=1 Tax=Ostreiculturibacter nitratireducens TaxID=3075226 RepID=UPI0031B590D1